jgi:hypothetical protein
MMSTTHSLTADYLRRLEDAAGRLPRREREELLAQVREHLAEGCPADATEAAVRNVLDELGTPEDIVAAAQPDGPRAHRGAREAFTLILLVTGLPPILGWLIGAGLLVWSPLWTGRQKLLGLLVWPGGYVVALGAATLLQTRSASCPGPSRTGAGAVTGCVTAGPSLVSILGIIVLLAAPLLVAAYLYRAAGRVPDPE